MADTGATKMPIEHILIYGAGMMGKGIALALSAIRDIDITLFDVIDFDALTPIAHNFKQLSDEGVLTKEEADERFGRITFTADPQDVRIRQADMVIECVFEDIQLKQSTFEKLEALCREDAIFCTNTSVMSPTEISAKMQHRDRFVGTHFWNPAYLIPLVEVVRTAYTDDKTMDAVMDILIRAGKKAVRCNKDVPGFIANRMQHALWREAISIVENGIADAQTVDEAVKYSFGLRLPQLPPLENADMVGTQLTYQIHEYLLPYLEDSHTPSKLLTEMLARGEKGYASGQGFHTRSEQDTADQKAALNAYLIKMTTKN